MAKLVSKTYGEALFDIAMEAGGERCVELLTEITMVRKILEENPGFDDLMKHPGVPKQEKLEVAETVFRGRTSDELASFLNIVISKERYGELPAIFDYFTTKVKEYQKIGIAYVTTAMDISDEEKKTIERRLLETSSYRKMEMHYSVDSDLIGGMVIRIGDRVVDSSIRTKLDQLTKQLLQIQLG